MALQTATDTEFYRNYDNYLREIANGGEIVVIRNGREIARALPPGQNVSFISDSLRGILKHDCNIGKERAFYHERAR